MHQFSPEIARKHPKQTIAKHAGVRRRPDGGGFKSGAHVGVEAILSLLRDQLDAGEDGLAGKNTAIEKPACGSTLLMAYSAPISLQQRYSMKSIRSAVGVALLFNLDIEAQITGPTGITYAPSGTSNQVLLTWEAIPTKQYRVLTTAALDQPWETVANTPLVASNNLVRFSTRADGVTRFYRVSKLDTDAPVIWRTVPASNSIAVPRQSQLHVYMNEESGFDTNSIKLTVGTNLPVTLADPRLSLAGNVLTYTPAASEFLGTNGQTLTNQLIIGDTLGYRATNTWPFKLELIPILASNVVVVSPGSALTLVSTNGDTYVFGYAGASSGLTNGAILVNTDANLPYKRLVVSVSEDPAAHTVSLSTVPASLADILQQGSVRFYAAEFMLDGPGVGLHDGGDDGKTISLAGFKLLPDGGKVQIETTAGRLFFDPDFSIAADFDWSLALPPVRMISFDLDISAEMAFDLTLRGTWTDTWSFAPEPRRIGRPLRQFRLLGCIPMPPPVLCIPVWAEAVWEFSLGTEGEVSGLATATAGFESSRSVAFGAQMRAGQWTPYSRESSRAVGYPATWQGGGAGRIRGFVEPRLTVYLESVVGPTANLRPYLELIGNACVQPGQAGADVSLFPGMNGTLALTLRGWDDDWGSLPSWEMFNARAANPLWHEMLTAPSGPPPSVAGNLVWIPCGTFTMGTPPDEPTPFTLEVPQTRVTISQGFWMGKYEVTQAEYLAVMGSNPSYFTGDLSYPVGGVNWNDAVAYCAALTARERKTGRLPAGYAYRLPTEAEWEYACRAGTTTPFHYGNELRSGMANFDGRAEYPPCGGSSGTCWCWNQSGIYLGRTTSVGSYAPNAWGLYDMHGNMWEWCQDWFDYYAGGIAVDPQGPATGSSHVIRGGNWREYGHSCRSAARSVAYETRILYDVGFRMVLARGQP
jgi:formylglycine-generating enzyme required for sulfatase activity